MLETDERKTIEAAQAGNVDAFERLYRQHSGRVYGLCLRLCENDAEAQDCTQDTFVSAWQQLETFRSDSKLGTWLHRIAVNVVLGRKRRAATEERRFVVIDAREMSTTEQPHEIEALEQAIRRLPERTREVFVLQKVYGYTHEQTSEMLGVAVGTCKAQVHRAMRLLNQALTEDDAGAAKTRGTM